MLIGRGRLGQHAGTEIDVVVTLRRAVDAVGPVQPGIEPLRRVGGAHLARHHEAHLVEVGAGILLGVEITALPAPVGPGPGQPVEHLLGAGLADAGCFRPRRRIGLVAPQPGWHVGLRHRAQLRRHAGLAEIFLGQHVAGDLRPFRRHLDVALLEDQRAIRLLDLADRPTELDRRIRRLANLGESTADAHLRPPARSLRGRLPFSLASRPLSY